MTQGASADSFSFMEQTQAGQSRSRFEADREIVRRCYAMFDALTPEERNEVMATARADAYRKGIFLGLAYVVVIVLPFMAHYRSGGSATGKFSPFLAIGLLFLIGLAVWLRGWWKTYIIRWHMRPRVLEADATLAAQVKGRR
jgi:hypothetical protein